MKFILSVFTLLIFNLTGYAQTHTAALTLTGKVLDRAGKALEAVTVSLYSMPDSVLVTGSRTGEDGSYHFSIPHSGPYVLEARMLGYQSLRSQVIVSGDGSVTQVTKNPAQGIGNPEKVTKNPGQGTENQAKGSGSGLQHLPDLILLETARQLKGAAVTAQRPFIERQADKIVVNVENSVVSSGSSALEVLQRTPGITLDKDDHLQLKGKAGVTVMLDGRLTYLSADQITNLLKNMASENISRIELITNPSAKYDAQGNTGIINIITKKGRKAGLNGSLTAAGSRGNFYTYSTGLNLNYKTRKFNFFGDYNYSDRKNIFTRYNNSTFSTSPLSGDVLNTRNVNSGTHNQYKAGFDYNLTKNQVLNFTGSGYTGIFEQNAHGSSDLVNRNSGKQDTLFANHNQVRDPYYNITLAAGYKLTLDTAGKELDIDASYATFNDHNLISELNTPVAGTPPVQQGIATEQISHQPSAVFIKTIKADYTHPVDSTLKFETGAKASWVTTSNNFSYDSLADGVAARATRVNNFRYTERILAAYLSSTYKWKKVTLQAGLRLENTESIGDLITTGSSTVRNYTDLFPNLSATEKFNDRHTLAFSLTRRINRPDYSNLNPFIYYLDKFSYFIGNPNLKPTFTLQYELSYTFLQKYIATVSFANNRNYINEFASTDAATQTTRYTVINFNHQNSYNATISAPGDFTPWWTSTNNFSLNYNEYLNPLVPGASSKSVASWNLNIIETFKIPGDWKVEVNTFYNSSNYDGTYTMKPMYAVGGGIQKTLLKKKADLKFNVTDIFNTEHFYGNARYNNVNVDIRNKWESRRLTLAFTYRFGGTPDPEKGKRSGGQDESSRAGGKG